MNKHVVEGPGGTRTLVLETASDEREFKAALNTQEALQWAIHYPETPQSKLAKTWLKQNYGSPNPERVRKIIATHNKPKKSWQDNPLTYALVIVTLTVSGGLATKYLSNFLPPIVHSSTTASHTPLKDPLKFPFKFLAPQQTVQNQTLPENDESASSITPSSDTEHLMKTLPEQSRSTEEVKSHHTRFWHWLHAPFKQKPKGDES